ncbi:transcription elongation factor GreA [soil metagenome]
MSRAFVKEQDGEDAVEDLPERPVSTHPNAVTPRGLVLIDEEIDRLRKVLAHAQHETDRAGISRASRDLRYWTQRRSTAQLIESPKNPTEVTFGTLVEIERTDGRKQSFAIVGEDEANLEQGLIAYTTPLARALIGARAGDTVEAPGGKAEIVAITALPASAD